MLKKLIFKVQKVSKDSYFDPELFIFVKIFEFYLVTQSLYVNKTVFKKMWFTIFSSFFFDKPLPYECIVLYTHNHSL